MTEPCKSTGPVSRSLLHLPFLRKMRGMLSARSKSDEDRAAQGCYFGAVAARLFWFELYVLGRLTRDADATACAFYGQ